MVAPQCALSFSEVKPQPGEGEGGYLESLPVFSRSFSGYLKKGSW